MSTVTIVFVILKLTGVVTWSWWAVLAPTLIDVVVFIAAAAWGWYGTDVKLWWRRRAQ